MNPLQHKLAEDVWSLVIVFLPTNQSNVLAIICIRIEKEVPLTLNHNGKCMVLTPMHRIVYKMIYKLQLAAKVILNVVHQSNSIGTISGNSKQLVALTPTISYPTICLYLHQLHTDQLSTPQPFHPLHLIPMCITIRHSIYSRMLGQRMRIMPRAN